MTDAVPTTVSGAAEGPNRKFLQGYLAWLLNEKHYS